ncbi:type II toxin-antitoxin system ParD family antitoxin [Rhizobium puerariae]|uniref:Type II toxin-antitoxin system ParD family antitoxin n=1 Tax=Rhizobium puerariae TaxID=1585791 RepID=A0ABV6AB28_9HYPH
MNEKISITLPSQMVDAIKARVEAGSYVSTSEVMRAALRALDREEHILDQVVDAKIREAINDTRSGISADDVFDRLERVHEDLMKSRGRGR